MPSPFPGMDPYLEGSFWSPLHHSLAEEILRQLGPRIRPQYVALPEERYVVEIQDTRSDIYPDGAVAPSEIAEPGARRGPLKLATVVPTPVPHVTVEIRSTAGRRLVTAIEILSPTNKRDLRGFDLLLDYAEPPEVPLTPGEAEWARGILEAAALQPVG